MSWSESGLPSASSDVTSRLPNIAKPRLRNQSSFITRSGNRVIRLGRVLALVERTTVTFETTGGGHGKERISFEIAA